MKSVFKKVALAAAVAAAVVAPMAANAAALAAADLAINNLFLVDSVTGAPITTGLVIVGNQNTGNASADYNGVAGTGVGLNNITGSGDVDVKVRVGGSTNAAVLAAYGGNLENNTTSHVGTALGNYAIGDMFISGSAIGVGGTRGLTRADAAATGPTNVGGGNSTIQNSASVNATFTAVETMSVKFRVDYNIFVKTLVTLLGMESAVATASTGWALNIADNTANLQNFFVWSPNELTRNFSTFDADPNSQRLYDFAGTVVSQTGLLTAGHNYSLTISQNSNASVRDLPEPGSIALLGLGLLGVAAMRRRAVK